MKRGPWARSGFLLASIVCSTIVSAQWTDAERKGLDDALYLVGLTAPELRLAKAPPMGGWSPLAETATTSPLDGADRLMKLASATGKPSDLLRILRGEATTTVAGMPLATPTVGEVPDDVPVPFREPIGRLAGVIAAATAKVRLALKELSPDERRELIEGLPRWFVDRANMSFEFVRRPMASKERLRSLMSKVDLGTILVAGETLTAETERAATSLRAANQRTSFVGKLRFDCAGVAVVLGGSGKDVHTERDALLTIDLGGDDEYRGRHGAGIGYASVLLDLGGDDTYDVLDASVGAGILGVGIAFDAGGSDTVTGKSICFGAGLGGVGVWSKTGGRDRYAARSIAYGASAYGLGLCIDSGGDDGYRVDALGLGSSRTDGPGWLIDRDGDDVYRSPGIDGIARSQGSAFGEDDAIATANGGVGMLVDQKGADIYIAATDAQGTARSFGIGAILDFEGDDVYHCDQGQAYSVSSSGAYAIDLAGDDAYVLGKGGGQSFAQGLGLALFLDRSGTDGYDGAGGRLGSAAQGGAAFFVESDGDDRYGGVPGTPLRFGDAGALAIFTDLSGSDHYPDGLTDASAKVQAGWGVAFDRMATTERPVSIDDLPSDPPIAGSKPAPDDVKMAELWAAASRGDVGARDELAAIGKPALDYGIVHALSNANAETRATFGWIVTAIGESARNQVALKAAAPNDAEALSALLICFEWGFKEAGAVIVQAIDRPALRRVAAQAAGSFGAAVATPKLMALCLDKEPGIALDAMLSLATLGDPQSLGTAQALLESPDPFVRRAAVRAISKSPTAAVPIGTAIIGENDERRVRLGIEILSEIGTPEALAAIGGKLLDGRVGVRIQALLALNGRFTPDQRSALFTLQRDPDERVRGVALGVHPGR